MTTPHQARRALALLLATLLAAGPALANPPSWAGGGKGKHGGDEGKGHQQAGKGPQQGAYFNDRNRASVHKYYASHPGKGCPPGLAKKNNGCLPPGQAKKMWSVGQPLPSTVVYAPVPQQVIVTLPPVPSGHRYVEVAGDILLIALGTKMVVDGIHGLTR